MRDYRTPLSVTILISLTVLTLWLGTGGDWYTKFQIVEIQEQTIDPDDPFAGTGLYDSSVRLEPLQRDEFHFGLLPAGADRHLISVATFLLPLWALTLAHFLFRARRFKTQPDPLTRQLEGEKFT